MPITVDQTNFEAAISSVSYTFETNTTEHEHEHEKLAKLDVSGDPQLAKTDAQDDVIMMDDMETKVNGPISTYQKPHTPVLDGVEAAASHVPAVSLPTSANTLEDVMDVDQKVNEEEKVNGNDIYINDVDMDACSGEERDQEEYKESSSESSNEADEISEEEEEEKNGEEEKQPEPEHEPQVLDRKSLPPVPNMSLGQIPPQTIAQNYPKQHVAIEEANLPISVPEQEKQIKELVDPAKVCNKTTLPTSIILYRLLFSFNEIRCWLTIVPCSHFAREWLFPYGFQIDHCYHRYHKRCQERTKEDSKAARTRLHTLQVTID